MTTPDHTELQDAPARDLAAEARDARKRRARRVTCCPRCGENFTARFTTPKTEGWMRRHHWKEPHCVAAVRIEELKRMGYTPCGTRSWTAGLMRAAVEVLARQPEDGPTISFGEARVRLIDHLSLKKERTHVGPRWRHKLPQVDNEVWAPCWINSLFNATLNSAFFKPLLDTEVQPHFVRALLRAAQDPDYREALEALRALRGPQGVVDAVVPLDERVRKYRAQANELRRQALTIDRTGDELEQLYNTQRLAEAL